VEVFAVVVQKAADNLVAVAAVEVVAEILVVVEVVVIVGLAHMVVALEVGR